jgi:hypothetical protein
MMIKGLFTVSTLSAIYSYLIVVATEIGYINDGLHRFETMKDPTFAVFKKSQIRKTPKMRFLCALI